MNDRIAALRLFQRVARTGSFSKAGRERRLSQPSASRIIAALESDIGATLFVRTTRAVTLTEAGADYLARIDPILAALDEADFEARGTGALRGLVRVALSTGFGVREIVPRLPRFLADHPALRMELQVSDERQDLVSEGMDIAFRLGTLADSAIVARRLGDSERLLVASPAYLAAAGSPDSPSELANHSLIIGSGGGNVWRFERDDRQVSIAVEGRLVVAANEAAIAAATAGIGIASTSIWGCRTEIEGGALVPVMPGWRLPRVQLHAVLPAGRGASPAVRAFLDYLAPAFATSVASRVMSAT